MNPLFDCEAIIFDFDGVIIDSNELKSQAFASLYAGYGDAVVTQVVAFHKSNGGLSRFEKIRHFETVIVGNACDSAKIETLAEEFFRLVETKVISCPWIPGANELLDTLYQKTPMFVVSGTPHQELVRIIGKRNMSHYFLAALGTPPEKETLVGNIVEQYRLNPNKTVMVGDSHIDMRAATAHQLQFIGINPPNRVTPFPIKTLTLADLRGLYQYLNIIQINAPLD